MDEVDFQNEQREIFQLFHRISHELSEAEAEANSEYENNRVYANDFLNLVMKEVETQAEDQEKKTHELSHIFDANKWLMLSIAVYLLILIPWQYAIFVSQIISSVALSRAVSIWNMGETVPQDEDRWNCLWLMFIPFGPALVTLYYRLISYPNGLKAINERYPNAREQEEVLSLFQEGEQEHENMINQARELYRYKIAESYSTYNTFFQEIREASDLTTAESNLMGASWNDELWKSWTPMKEEPTNRSKIAPFIRIGNLIESDGWNELSMPAFLPVIGGRNVVIKVSGEEKSSGVQAVRSFMLRLLALVPPGKLRFTLIDPESSGHDLADFLRLKAYDEALTGKSVWTEPQDIEKQLTLLNERLGFITQNIIAKYQTIENYNANAGVMAEPYRVLVIINYPVNFTDSSIRYLSSIARNGPRCGIYTIMTVDTEKLEDT